MVGFNTGDDAIAQVWNRWFSVPAGAELGIRYDRVPTWGDFHPCTSTNEMLLTFYEYYSTPHATPIYSSRRDMAGPYSLEEQFQALTLQSLEPAVLEDESEFDDDVDDDSDSRAAEQASEDPLEGTSQQYTTSGPSAPPPPTPPVNFFNLTPEEIDQEIAMCNDRLWNLHRLRARVTGPYADLIQALPTGDPPQPVEQERPPQRSSSFWDLLKDAIKRRRHDSE